MIIKVGCVYRAMFAGEPAWMAVTDIQGLAVYRNRWNGAIGPVS